jgi:hypothetical protein
VTINSSATVLRSNRVVGLPGFGLAFVFVNKHSWTMDNGQWTMDNGQRTMDMETSSFSSQIIVIIIFEKYHHLFNPRVKESCFASLP